MDLAVVKCFGYDRNMTTLAAIAEIAAMMGDPVRANMLFALKDSECASAGDLTRAGNIAPSTASEHLAKMVDAGLIEVSKSGRHRYYRLTNPKICDVLEGLTHIARRSQDDDGPAPRYDDALLHARGCCDHLAGRLGVELAEALIGRGILTQKRGTLAISATGTPTLTAIGIDVARVSASPRRVVTLCHDWSENAFHLGGGLAGAMLQAFVARDWLRRPRGAETVRITPAGRAGFRQHFGIDVREFS